jgi:tetratricopeptide (TPR) repeat protein
LGEIDEAKAAFESALQIAQEIGDRSIEGNALGNLGVLNFEQGNDKKAIEFHKQCDLQLHLPRDYRNWKSPLWELFIWSLFRMP